VPLDAKGEAVIYWSGAYKVDLKQADGQQVTGYPVDNLKTGPGRYAYGVYTLMIDDCDFEQGSGGIYVDTCQKVAIDSTTVNNATNYGIYLSGCSSVFISKRTILNGSGQAGQASLYFDNCMSVIYENSRIKGGGGSLVKAGPGQSSNVRVANNHFEVYSNTDDAIALNSGVENAVVDNNDMLFIGQGYTYPAGIALRDRAGGGITGVSHRITNNRIIVGGADTLTDAILVKSTLNSFRAVVVDNNNIGGGGVASIVTNAINFAGIGYGNAARFNNIGNNGGSVTNGLVVGNQQTSAWLDSNQYIGAVTNRVVDGGVLTRQYESGTFNLTVTDCTTVPVAGCAYERQGRTVTLKILSANGTSNSVNCQLSGLPASIQPPSSQWLPVPVIDNGADFPGWALVTTSGNIVLAKNTPVSSGGLFTNVGTKGIRATTITYTL
jgi:hypothetical protein